MYEGDNFDGSWEREIRDAGDYNADWPHLNNELNRERAGFTTFPNDELSSLRVLPGCEVKLFQKYVGSASSGWEAHFSAGEYDKNALEAAGAIANDASSLRVVGCYKTVIDQDECDITLERHLSLCEVKVFGVKQQQARLTGLRWHLAASEIDSCDATCAAQNAICDIASMKTLASSSSAAAASGDVSSYNITVNGLPGAKPTLPLYCRVVQAGGCAHPTTETPCRIPGVLVSGDQAGEDCRLFPTLANEVDNMGCGASFAAPPFTWRSLCACDHGAGEMFGGIICLSLSGLDSNTTCFLL